MSIVAFIGATGGAGTTRTAVETGAMLARDGHDVAVLDAAYATQGLSQYLPGRLVPDVTALVTDERDAPLSAGLVEFDADAPGRFAACPAAAPFERLARASSVDAARAFEARLAEAVEDFEFVLVDVEPLATNQAVAAVTAADRVVTVSPGTDRGADARQSLRGRLADVGAGEDVAVAVGGDALGFDAFLPRSDAEAVADTPACLGDDSFAAAVAEVTELACGCSLDVEFEKTGVLGRFARN